jgi:hypothetical protein
MVLETDGFYTDEQSPSPLSMDLETEGFHTDEQSRSVNIWLWRLKDFIGMDNVPLHNLWFWRLKYFIGMNNLPSLIYGCFHPLQYFRPSHPLNISVHCVSLFIRVTSQLVSNCPRVHLQYVCSLTVIT